MIKTKKIIKTEEVDIIEDIICNKCGESCCIGSYSENNEDKVFNGLIEYTASGHYLSSYLSDTTTYKFSLCEKCLSDSFKEFKISVQTVDDNFG